jgi:hypothetical protein
MILKTCDDDSPRGEKTFGILRSGLNFKTGHEIHSEKETSPIRKQIKEECQNIKNQIAFDEDEEIIDVVKGEEGEFYSVK